MSEPDLAAEVYVALGRLVRSLRQEVPTSEVGPGGLSVLMTLGAGEPQRPGALAEIEGVSAASMTRILNALDTLGMITRQPDPRDGRAQVIGLTDHGREVIENGRGQRLIALRRRLDTLGEADRVAIEAALPALAALAGTPH